MKMAFAVLIFLLVAGCASADLSDSPNIGNVDTITPSPTEVSELDPCSLVEDPDLSGNLHLENLGPAPELNNQIWLNTDQALRLEDLRGQVVLLEMWTFG